MTTKDQNITFGIFNIFLLKKYPNFSFMNLLLIMGIIGVIPFVINGFFVNPASDDFIYANTSLNQGAWNAQINWYQGWTGRYFTTFILTNSPLVYGWLFGYKLIPLIIMVLLFSSIYSLLRSISDKYFTNKTIITFTLVVLFIYLHRFPSPTWGLFWMSGTITYQLANIFTLFLLSAIIWIFKRKNTIQSTVFTIVGSVSIFIAVGCNEITMILINALLLTVTIIDYLIHKKINFYLLWLIILTFSLSIFVFMSPGQEARETHWEQSHQLIPSIIATLRRAISQILFRFIWSPLLVLSIIAFPLFNRLGNYWVHKKTSLFNINPLVAFVWLLFLPTLFFPLHYSLGPNEPNAERITNIIFLIFIFNWFYFEILLITYLKRNNILSLNNLKVPVILWWLMIMFYVIFPFREHNSIRTAYEDLFSGKTYMHNKLMGERIEYLKNSDCTDCTVDYISYYPETIVYRWFYINGNKDFWMNKQAAKYFGKNSISIVKKNKNNTDHD